MVIDFFEWKFNHRIVLFHGGIERLRDFLEIELAEALKQDNERLITGPTDTLF